MKEKERCETDQSEGIESDKNRLITTELMENKHKKWRKLKFL